MTVPPASAGLAALADDALWREVTTRAGDRCQCSGQCGRKHKDGGGRCPAENTPQAPLHAVPREPAEPGGAATRPASAHDALCDPCHAALAVIHAKTRQAAHGALSAVETLF